MELHTDFGAYLGSLSPSPTLSLMCSFSLTLKKRREKKLPTRNGETQGEDGVLTINLSGQLIDRELLSEPEFPELWLQEKARPARLRRGTQVLPTMVSSVVDKQ